MSEEDRPLCACHGQPMWSNGPNRLVCRVEKAESKRNSKRDPAVYAAQREREAKRKARKALLSLDDRSKLRRMRKAAASRYTASLELNRAVRGVSASARPIDRGPNLPPLCSCHHEPMRKDGDYYRCSPRRKETVRRTEFRRRAWKAGVPSEPYTRQAVYERDAGRCRYCDEHVGNDWHIAHLVALARGGEDTLDNVAVSCATCNLLDGTGRLPVQLHLPRAA